MHVQAQSKFIKATCLKIKHFRTSAVPKQYFLYARHWHKWVLHYVKHKKRLMSSLITFMSIVSYLAIHFWIIKKN